MPNANFSELVTTTLQRYSGKIADNITNHNALLNALMKKGNMTATQGGRTIVQETEYAQNGTVAYYSGYDVISTNTNQILTAAEFDWKQLAGTIKFSGLEVDVQNASAEQVHNLVTTRIKNLEKSLKNTVAIGLYADGTGSSGKEIGGLQSLVADAPATGIVGGINRATDAWWQNQVTDGSTVLGAAMTAANINGAMNDMWLKCVRGADRPDIIVADPLFFNMYWTYLQSLQRVMSVDVGEAGFSRLKYMGVDVFHDDACPASHMYFLNTDYLYFRYASKRNFTALSDRAPSDVGGGTVDATVRPVVWAGNLTMSNASLQGVLVA